MVVSVGGRKRGRWGIARVGSGTVHLNGQKSPKTTKKIGHKRVAHIVPECILVLNKFPFCSPQAMCSSFGTVITPSHAASSSQSVASPSLVLIVFPVQRPQESPFL